MRKTLAFKAEDRLMKDVLFANDVRFRIPRYQRPYAWGEDDVEELWNDLLQDETLFVGSMIFNYEHVDIEGYIDVIDGQQRLLSITILEAVLRDTSQVYDPKLSELIQEFEIALKDREGQLDFRVRCGDTTRPFFEHFIQKGAPNIRDANTKTAEERRIKSNYNFFFEKVISEIDRFQTNEEKIAALRRIRKKIETLVVIHVRIDSEEEAYEIFETTNARGVDLSVADLVKNLIFKKIRVEDGRDKAKDMWEEIRDNIQDTGTDLKRFIRYHWISKHKSSPEKRLFREIKRHTTDWQRLLDDLHRDADTFNDLYVCNEAEWRAKSVHPDVYSSLRSIRRMNFKISYIFLMRLFTNYQMLSLNPRSVVKCIENFTFLYSAISRQPINKCEKIYSSYAEKLDQAVQAPEKQRRVAVEKVLAGLKKELCALIPPFDVFKESFLAVAYKKNSAQARDFVKYVLESVNAYMAPTRETLIDPNNVNIEHLLPQSPEHSWGLTKRDVSGYVHLLGNLTLVDKRINSQAGDECLAKKLADLESSQLPITADLIESIRCSSMNWGETEIKNRQKQLAELAYNKVWRIPR